MAYTLGSLFDGSGGFPLCATMCGIEPRWAAEVEPYPIAVTRSRFPNMKHLGDVQKVNGAEIEPVDIISFGSPCQDLSIAGGRKGLKHEEIGDEETTRSGLFMEAVRIIKEMRDATNGRYPTFALWENVPGAFSSNRGEDFRTVLESLIQIAEPDAVMPEVPKGGWAYADSYRGDGWSIAYRVLNAQFWGVPQRRRRIYLVADFRGTGAREILFERKGLRGHFAGGRSPWQGAACHAEESTGEAGTLCLNDQGGQRMDVTEDVTNTLRAGANHPPLVFENHSQDSRYTGPLDVAQTVLSTFGTGGNNQPFVVEPSHRGSGYSEDNVSFTLNATEQHAVAVEHYCASKNSFFMDAQKEQANTLLATDYKDPPLINDRDGADYIVRRLTPTECARLQGFPDHWGWPYVLEDMGEETFEFWKTVRQTYDSINGRKPKDYTKKQILTWYNKLHTDSSEYKMWGNGIALPTALYVMQGIADELGEAQISAEDETGGEA